MKGGSADSVAKALTEALRAADEAGVRRPRLKHLESTDIDVLTVATLIYLRTRPSKPSPNPGWVEIRSFDASVNRWWNEQLEAPFPSDISVRLQTLRGDVYDHLQYLGHLVKEPGQTSPIHIAPERGLGTDLADESEVTVTSAEAFFGDPLTNRLVERAAMDIVIAHFGGWGVTDVSAHNCGWDLTFCRNEEEVHAEVKGVSGRRPLILLTRNEFEVAGQDPNWRLLVVTGALIDPQVHEYPPNIVGECSAPYAYKVDLRGVE
jgi:hypothetical protein